MFTKVDFRAFCMPLIPGLLIDFLADTCQPTIEKTRKSAPALTSTNQNAFLFRINNIPGMRGARGNRECPLECVKQGHMANNVYNTPKTGMCFGISDMSLFREMSKYQKGAPCATGMSCRINNMTIRARRSKWLFYSTVTSAEKGVAQHADAGYAEALRGGGE